MAKSERDEDVAATERLHKLARAVIALREEITVELFTPRWKEPRHETAYREILAAEMVLDEARRHLNAAKEAEIEYSRKMHGGGHD